MKPGEIRCPRCFAPPGKPCITEAGITRPVHAERLGKATSKTFEAVSAGLEDFPDVRSARFEENEDITMSPEQCELLAETAVAQLQEIIESAESDQSTNELVVYARTAQGIEITERLQSLAELRASLR